MDCVSEALIDLWGVVLDIVEALSYTASVLP